MTTIQLLTGETISLWCAVFPPPPTYRVNSRPRKVLLQVPDGQAPATTAYQLAKAGRLPHQWERLEEASEEEIDWWLKRHMKEVEGVDIWVERERKKPIP